jgi:hypothetical protein
LTIGRGLVESFGQPQSARLAFIVNAVGPVVGISIDAVKLHRLRAVGALELFAFQAPDSKPAG